MAINVADANIENLVKSTGLDEFQLAELINAKADEGWSNEEITDFLINEMTTENQAAKDEVYAMLGTHEPTWKDYYKLETKKKDPSLLQRLGMWLDENKAADEQRNANARAVAFRYRPLEQSNDSFSVSNGGLHYVHWNWRLCPK